jgi:hypothetical protein
LLELKLLGFNVHVQQGAADGFPGVVQGCTKLTRLQLECVVIDGPEDDAVLDGSLSSLVRLQHLEVIPRARAAPLEYHHAAGLSSITLPHLQHLSCLIVTKLNVENLMQLSCLTNLQMLDLTVADDTTVGPNSVPGLVFPASLKTLFLSSTAEAGLLSLFPTGLQELNVDCDVQGPAEGPGSFLFGMARLQHLTDLLLAISSPVWPLACPAYSALTASSNLVNLEMVDTYFPPGIWSHVFPAAHKLPHLTCLTLRSLVDDVNHGVFFPHPEWGAADLSSLVSSCPGLCSVESMYLQPGLHVSELHKLSALKYIDVHLASIDLLPVVEGIKGLAVATQLQSLCLDTDCAELVGAHLLPLTSLTALTNLSCTLESGSWRLSSEVESAQVNILLHTCLW